MMHIQRNTCFNHMLRAFYIHPSLIVLALCIFISLPVASQTLEPVTSIRELRDGYLIVRFPSMKSKIDTLQSMARQATDPATKTRLEKVLNETTEQRDATIREYTDAFRTQYNFSKVAFFMDYESRDLSKAQFQTIEGKTVTWEQINTSPVYFLYFERTEESKIDALVVYNNEGKIVPRPFPNNFTRGGFSFLFLKFTERSIPDSKVKNINKRFYKFWEDVTYQKTKN